MITYPCVCDDLPPHEHEVVRELGVASSLAGGKPMVLFRRTEHIARFWVDWRAVARGLLLNQAAEVHDEHSDTADCWCVAR